MFSTDVLSYASRHRRDHQPVAAGTTVVERIPHHLPPNPHNERYLATKRDRTGHQL